MSYRRRIASELKARLAAVTERGAYRRFVRGEGGAIAIYFGLSALVFVGVAGLAVDAARGYLVKARLSEAIDAAALAGGKALQTANDPSNAKVNSDATAFFNANFPNGAMGANVAVPQIVVGNNNTVVTVSSSATIPTTLMRVLGFNNMQVVAAATVARAQSGLDVVFSFDISGSMCAPCSKIQALQSNAKALVDSLFKPFTTGGQQQTVNVNGNNYSLLNIGVVPWSAKVNVLTYPATTPGTVTSSNLTFTDPMGRYGNLTKIYAASNSKVPLLYNPSTLPNGWKGCVFARYTDDGDQTNDADTTLGAVTVNGKSWPGWEPMASDEAEPQSGRGANCDASFWNNNQNSNDGSAIPPGWPSLPFSLRHNEECTDCPSVGILPLQTDATTVKNMIDTLVPGGNTDAPQGLFWAWEVLMPGDPFNEAKVNPPFQRAQAIVFMTDGQNVGGNGDAYHGWFGSGEDAGTLTSKGNMTMPDGSSVKNNLNNHLLQLAAKIKGTTPLDPAAVKIYVIQYQETDPNLGTLLKAVATQPQAPFYFFAPDTASLNSIFDQIAASLSALRIVQ
jgi:Flp pilus assembly protein TadG